MDNKASKDQLIIPIYLNEKTVLDMLAIMEDGFSMVSEISSSNQDISSTNVKVGGGISTKAILDKLLKIQLDGSLQKDKNASTTSESKLEKVHTNVSLLSKFRTRLIDNDMMICKAGENLDFSKIETGDFIELEGELQKNPMIDIMEKFVDVFRMAEIFEDKPELVGKKIATDKKKRDNATLKQIRSFLDELKHTGTVDFILENPNGTLVVSTQEQYLSNDNISEILGGTFKILGKVIKVCKNNEEGINLLRKTTLNILDQDSLTGFMEIFRDPELTQFNLPEVRFIIESPSAIVIPIAIYA